MDRHENSEAASPSTRREFARTLALMAAMPLVAPDRSAGADEPKTDQPQKEQVPEPVATAQALTEIVRRRHGQQLSEEQLKAVQGSIERALRAADRLKSYPLKNGDEPAFAFTAAVPTGSTTP